MVKPITWFFWMMISSLSSVHAHSRQDENISALPIVGSEIQICHDCPAFIRVPDAPKTMRPIRFVAKYELTWDKYLAAYDAGKCKIPNPNNGMGAKPKPNDFLANVEKLRVEWPANKLGPAEVQCYIDWLQEKTPYTVALPTPEEWEWFARAGRLNAKFPWGDDPDASKEALCGNEAIETLRRPPLTSMPIRHHMSGGVAPGQFPPNNWGLYDIMGSLYELTSTVISGAEKLRQHPDSKWAKFTKDKDNMVVKGGDSLFCGWDKKGISGQNTVVIWDGSFSADVAVRLILIEK